MKCPDVKSIFASAQLADDAESVMEAVSEGRLDGSLLSDLWQDILAFLPTLIFAAVIYLVGKIIVRLIMRIIDRGMNRSHIDQGAQSFLKSLTSTVLTACIIVISLSALGIPMTSIITVLGAAGVAVGLALQDSLSNVAGGFIILFTKPFNKGDYIISNGVEGTVDDIKIMSTVLKTSDNKVVYIPNGMVAGGMVTNFSREETRRVDLVFGISGGQDFHAAVSIIRDIAAKHELILKGSEPFVRVSALKADSTEIKLCAWTKNENYFTVYHDLLESVKSAFDANGIIPPRSGVSVEISERRQEK